MMHYNNAAGICQALFSRFPQILLKSNFCRRPKFYEAITYNILIFSFLYLVNHKNGKSVGNAGFLILKTVSGRERAANGQATAGVWAAGQPGGRQAVAENGVFWHL